MITLKGKLKKDGSLVNGTASSENKKRPSIRDQLLVKEVQEMEQTLPPTCEVFFENPHQLHEFKLIVTPDEGFWTGGRFVFQIFVTEDYNMAVRDDTAFISLLHYSCNSKHLTLNCPTFFCL